MKKNNLILLSLLFLCGCNGDEKGSTANGYFEATEVTVSAESNGRILDLHIQEGDTVKAGEKIGAIDSMQLYLTKLQLQKNVKSVSANKPDVETQIAYLQEQLNKQLTEKTRIENMLKDNAATQKMLDDVNSHIKVLETQIAAQKSTLQKSNNSIDAQSSSIEMQIAQVQDKLSKCSVTSPINGTILNKYAEAGEFAAIGKPLFKVANINDMTLRAYVTSGQLMDLKIGQEVEVTANFGGEKTLKYKGIIKWISPKSEFTPKNIQTQSNRENLVYAIKIGVKNDGFIKIGMFGNVSWKE
ncbi:MAG: HlyD family efflux transporter periplasmic adaptor subunit [Paludibacteraceae bacterium]|nr:HlyD family efflux transporter periplasmic adaptor subunit [Paludibacteraceae bacterium]